MAELKVEVLKIENVTEHPNADRLDLATVLGYQVVVGRGQYKPGDLAVYFPVDSLLRSSLQEVIFKDTVMKLSRNRVRAARIRGAMSFGLLVAIPQIQSYMMLGGNPGDIAPYLSAGQDLTAELGVDKYEPPVKGVNMPGDGSNKLIRYNHPEFARQYEIQHFRKHPVAFDRFQGETVVTEKIHGMNFRAGWLPFEPRTKVQKFLKFLTDYTCWKFVPEYEFVYGTHNTQIDPTEDNSFADVFTKAVDKFELRHRISLGELWFYELVTPGAQKNYDYGLAEGDVDIYTIDIRDTDGTYLCWDDLEERANTAGLPFAPVMLHIKDPEYAASFGEGILEIVNIDINSPRRVSMLDGKTSPIEGGVVRPLFEDKDGHFTGRRIFKCISDEYLLNRSNTDEH